MNQDQIDGLTKARLASNIMRASTEEPQFITDDQYVEWVCSQSGISELPEEALNSYAENWSATEIGTLTQALKDLLDARKIAVIKTEQAVVAQIQAEQAEAALQETAAVAYNLVQS